MVNWGSKIAGVGFEPTSQGYVPLRW